MDKEFVEYYKQRVSGSTAFGITIDNMNRDELLAVIGMLQSNLEACYKTHKRDLEVLGG